jgi:hypothetical protein
MDPAPADPLGGGTEFYESVSNHLGGQPSSCCECSESGRLSALPRAAQIRYLGGGTFGSVWLARERASGNVFALKFIDRQDQMTNHLLREILNHSRLQCARRLPPRALQLPALPPLQRPARPLTAACIHAGTTTWSSCIASSCTKSISCWCWSTSRGGRCFPWSGSRALA